MVEDITVETDVDMLVSLVEQKGTISIEQAAKTLKVQTEVLQRWIDFLVEEGVLGIEYKFVTPYLYFNKPLRKHSSEEEIRVEEKKDFFSKAKKDGIDEHIIKDRWQNYLMKNLSSYRKVFVIKAKEKGLSEGRIDSLWEEYYAYLKGDSV